MLCNICMNKSVEYMSRMSQERISKFDLTWDILKQKILKCNWSVSHLKALNGEISFDEIQSIARKYRYNQERDYWVAWRYIGLSFSTYICGILVGIFAWNYCWQAWPIAWLIMGFGQNSIASMAHDVIHGGWRQFWPMRLLRKPIEWLMFYPAHVWRISHNFGHHPYCGNMEARDTIRWEYEECVTGVDTIPPFGGKTLLKYKLGKILVPCIAFLGSSIGNFIRPADSWRERLDLCRSLLETVLFATLFNLVIYRVCGSFSGNLNFCIMPFMVANHLFTWFVVTHHADRRLFLFQEDQWEPLIGQVMTSVNCLCPKWLSILTHHLDHQVVHHIDPLVPGFNLPLLRREIAQKYPGLMFESKWTLWSATNKLHEIEVWSTEDKQYYTAKEWAKRNQEYGNLETATLA